MRIPAVTRLTMTLALAVALVPPAGADTLDSLRIGMRDLVIPAAPGEREWAVEEPAGIAVDAFGHLFVTDARRHRVVRFDSTGTWVGSEGALGSDPGQFRRPGAVAMLGTLQTVVLDRENHRVVRYDRFGHFQDVLIDLDSPANQDLLGHVEPADLAADRGGAIAIVDRDAERLLLFDFSGNYLRTVGGFGERPGLFRGLSGVTFTAHGDLLTIERQGSRIQRLDPGGRAIASWPITVSSNPGALSVAASEAGRIAAADEATGRVLVMDRGGATLAIRDGFDHPRALAFTPGGALLVAGGNGRVQRLDFATEPAARDSARGE